MRRSGRFRNLSVVRPADANETVAAWAVALENRSGPVALALTRQNVPVLAGTAERAAEGTAHGGYVLVDAATAGSQTPGLPDVLLIATGSEVQLAVAAASTLAEAGIAARVVSMPCMEWFDQQPLEYRESVLPPQVRARVAVEAGSPLSWWRMVGDSGRVVGIDHFGASADQVTLFDKFGITAEAVVKAAHESLAAGFRRLNRAVNAIRRLADQGVSVWLDDLGRDRLTSGELARLVADGVCGVTTNPSIFAAAVSKGSAYAPQLASLGGLPPDEALHALMVEDVRSACDVLGVAFEESGFVDGRVSLEVDPRLAFDTEATIAAARGIWGDVDRPNVMVKIPATRAGLPAITETLASGISVNVTLIFGIDRYLEVQNAWLAGLEAARARGHDLASIGSVASFFVSRLDTSVDGQLDAMAAAGSLGADLHRALRGRAAVANARNAYRRYRQLLTDPRWLALESVGAQPQRPLWASTSAKDPSFSPTRYVDELVAPQTVNTMPSATLGAVVESLGRVAGDDQPRRPRHPIQMRSSSTISQPLGSSTGRSLLTWRTQGSRRSLRRGTPCCSSSKRPSAQNPPRPRRAAWPAPQPGLPRRQRPSAAP